MGDEKLLFDLSGADSPSPVPLAHVAAFHLGPLTVEPARRRMIATDGSAEMLEPLVLQVLIALVSAQGRTLSRDDLIGACWDGRIVSDDAINRVMSKLRRVLTELAGDRVWIETVTKVGYRLIAETVAAEPPDGIGQAQALPRGHARRKLALFVGLAALAGTVGVAWTARDPVYAAEPLTIAVEPVGGIAGDRQVRAFANALTGDLAKLAGAISQVSFVDDQGRARSDHDYIVRIAVERDGNDLLARARLVNVADGAVLWSDRFVENARAPDRLRERVAMATAGVMRCGLERSAQVLKDAATIRLFFSACDAVMNEDFARGRSFARQVVARRPDVAAGWSCLALTTLSELWSPGITPERMRVLRAQGRRYAHRALKLDPNSGRGYQALALAERQGSVRQLALLAQGIAVEPELPALYRVQSTGLFNAGYVDASLAAAQRAMALDPSSSVAFFALERRLLASGRIEEALAMQAKAERLWPAEPETIRHAIWTLPHDPDATTVLAKYDSLIRQLPSGDGPIPMFRTALRWRIDPAARDRAALDREAEAAFAEDPVNAWLIIATLNRIGERERALTWLARAPRQAARSQSSVLFRDDAAELRREPRFFAAMAKLGLVEDWRTTRQWPDFCADRGLRYDCRVEAARLARGRPSPA